jgi:Tat protein secretion system quality control protein TatD with DNase activity
MKRDTYIGSLAGCLFCFVILLPSSGALEVLPIIDAHSQFDEGSPGAQVIQYAAKAGVSQVLLSARGRVTTAQVLDLHARYAGCVVPSVRTKGREFAENQSGYPALLDEQFGQPAFSAMSEIILAHAAKGKRAPEVYVAADSPQVQEAIGRGHTRLAGRVTL